MSPRGKSGSEPRLQKCPTGIRGLDEITEGGLPRGRPTLVCGDAGSGKTLLAMEFIVRGIREFGEPGAFMAFEETTEDLAANVASLGFDLPRLIRQRKLQIDYVQIERSEIVETGEYDLEGLFVRLDSMINRVGAKRVALDTLESLFAGLPNEGILRAELRRLFHWLKKRKVTAVVTAERGENSLTRHGLEEYVSDCVILLDHRVDNQIATRRLRVVKYRGSKHGTNEYPTLIDGQGLSVLPISSLGLNYPVSTECISTGVDALDAMLGAGGYYRGSSVLVSGTAGTGKSTLAVAFGARVCGNGGRCLYTSLEESPGQITRNMKSVGFDINRYLAKGLWKFNNLRPTALGLESHLVAIHKLVEQFRPDAMVVDPFGGMTSIGESGQVRAMLTRLIDFLKTSGITTVFTSLTAGGSPLELTDVDVSSLMDTWILLRMLEVSGERRRVMYVLKSRGMSHSNKMREYQLSDRGIQLLEEELLPSPVAVAVPAAEGGR